MDFQDLSLIRGYHAHVYFDAETIEFAKTLCEEAGKLFSVTVGRVHQKPVGPHPLWSLTRAFPCAYRRRGVARQLAFENSKYANLLSWLALNRQELTILIHPLTGNDLKDHTDYAAWMGEPQALKLEVLR